MNGRLHDSPSSQSPKPRPPEITAGPAEAGHDRYQLRTLLLAHRWRVTLLSACSAAGGLVEAFFLVIVTRAAFAITEGRSEIALTGDLEVTTSALILLSVLMVAVRVALAVLSAWLSAQLGANVVAEIRGEIASAYLNAEWAAQQREDDGKLQELLTTFANQGANLIAGVTQAIISACTLAALLLIAITVDPASALSVSAGIFLLGSTLRPVRSAVKKRALQASQAGMGLATAVNEVSNLRLEMHVFNVQSTIRHRLLRLIDETESTNQRVTFLRGIVPAIYTGLAYVALVLALAIAASLPSEDLKSIGAVMLVMLRSLTYGQAFQANLAGVTASLPFVERLNDELLHYQKNAAFSGPQGLPTVQSLCLRSASFEYNPGQPVIREVDAQIAQREAIGIVGPSGSGKSTLIHLLVGLRRPTDGKVLANGLDLTNVSRRDWAKKVAYVPQEPRLLSGTISDNVRFFRNGIGQHDIEAACRMAHIHDEITKFADGYDHLVGGAGARLSGGQAQRLAIARALVEDPDVLILDEPTSALDVRSEALIRHSLRQLKDRMTVVIVAHRVSTLEICDRIMVIEDGYLVAFDSPNEIEHTNAFFRESLKLSGLR